MPSIWRKQETGLCLQLTCKAVGFGYCESVLKFNVSSGRNDARLIRRGLLDWSSGIKEFRHWIEWFVVFKVSLEIQIQLPHCSLQLGREAFRNFQAEFGLCFLAVYWMAV